MQGRRLGKYVLQRRIAVGGMGEIFYGKIPGVEGFEREVAIKKMLPHLSADGEFINMMIKEAKLTVLLNHPNIVQVYDLAKEGSEYYIAMEYVPGINVGTMLEKCRKGRVPVPVDAAIYITSQVLRGLGYAHELRGSDGQPMNVLHRDITPQNIMVTPDAWVKIADFGIAKARNEISTTSPGMIKGKLGYIAPEQITGAELDRRVDIFCAGILLWECLAVRRLFKGTSEIDTFRLISEANVPSIREIRDDVPEEVEKVIYKALAKETADRYATSEEFYDALNQAIFPRNIDELANSTKAFFADHAEFFEGVGGSEEDNIDATVELDTSEKPLPADAIPVTDKPTVRAPRKSAPWAAIAAIVLIGALAASAWAFRDRLGLQSPGEPAPPTEPSTENLLAQEEIQLAVDGERTRLTECYEGGTKIPEGLGAHLVIPSTGGVAQATLTPKDAELGKTGTCLVDVLRKLKFRPHSQAKVEADVSLPPPPEKPTGGSTKATKTTKNRGPAKALTAQEVRAMIQKNINPIARCARNAKTASGELKFVARLNIEASGRISNARLDPPVSDASVNQCLVRALKGIRFRRHARDLPVNIPLTLKSM